MWINCKSVYTGSISVPASTIYCKINLNSPSKTICCFKISVHNSYTKCRWNFGDSNANILVLLVEDFTAELWGGFHTNDKKLRLDKWAGSDNWYARLTLPNGKRLVKTTKTVDVETAKKWSCVSTMRLMHVFKTSCQPLPVSLRMLPDTLSTVCSLKYVRVWAAGV